MGNLTAIMIHNDHLSQVLRDHNWLTDLIKHHASGLQQTKQHSGIKLFQSRHKEVPTMYVMKGNTMVEIAYMCPETEHLMKEHTEIYDDIINHVEEQLKVLKKERAKIDDQE